ncbi:hypothetical protein NO559_16115 [Dasania sp. GY-MA-18]|uniref:Uncharacterized protein n=1 Tax=Dasania phycosphaerae TaxID=2950436 RepID=A0A9J6RR65_9GAMM|nr:MULTISPECIES: hypothetical protein [Dasania]MCR8924303.1 hypothetical protein [Dasania sp. GY-MA-18]MCZ0866956.1 hypothetical protein [Dasania phycosphaerae]MCZ0870460.1 hypothetical protein [Dasania phycosphaerae]
MTDLHIDDFYKDVAKIFIQLYNSFPNKTVLYVDDITGSVQQDEFGLYSERYLSALSTMLWLADSGYIHYSSCIKQEALDQAVLSEKGFILLSTRSTHAPIELEEEPTVELPTSIIRESQRSINLLRKALSSGSSLLIEQQVTALLTVGAGN